MSTSAAQVTTASHPDRDELLDGHRTDQPTKTKSRPARKILSLQTLGQGGFDLIIAIASLYFVIFAILVKRHEGQPADSSFNTSLLEAARYVSLSQLPRTLEASPFPNSSQQGAHNLPDRVCGNRCEISAKSCSCQA